MLKIAKWESKRFVLIWKLCENKLWRHCQNIGRRSQAKISRIEAQSCLFLSTVRTKETFWCFPVKFSVHFWLHADFSYSKWLGYGWCSKRHYCTENHGLHQDHWPLWPPLLQRPVLSGLWTLFTVETWALVQFWTNINFLKSLRRMSLLLSNRLTLTSKCLRPTLQITFGKTLKNGPKTLRW